jgi:hypothetical protein
MTTCVRCDADALAGKPTCADCAPDSPHSEGVAKLRPAMPQPCAMCPWRSENQEGEPPQHEGSEPWFYTATTRAAMWEHWGPNGEGLSDGTTMFCHRTGAVDGTGCRALPGSKPHECTGCAALQQRALLRAVRSRELGPLRGNAALEIAARMLGVTPRELRGWKLHGKPITGEDLVAAAHPAVLDPAIASEQVPAPTADELDDWTRRRG